MGLIIGIIILVLLIAAFAGSGSDESSKVDNSNATKTTQSNTSTDSSSSEKTTKEDASGVVKVGGSYEDNGLKFTVDGAELNYEIKNDEYGMYTLDDGLVYLKVDFTFENTGDSDKYVSIYDFDCYADNATCDQQYVTQETGDFVNTNLSAGRTVSFTTFYAVPEGAKSIELEYTSNIWISEKVVVQIK